MDLWNTIATDAVSPSDRTMGDVIEEMISRKKKREEKSPPPPRRRGDAVLGPSEGPTQALNRI